MVKLLVDLRADTGTLRPDLIESGSQSASLHADAIKTHHNDSQMVRQLRQHGRVVEPLKGTINHVLGQQRMRTCKIVFFFFFRFPQGLSPHLGSRTRFTS